MPLLRSLRSIPATRLTSRRTFLKPTSALRVTEHKQRSGEELEGVKQEQLKKQREGKGEWHEELASAGEQNIAADKQDVEDHGEHMEDLQKMGSEQAQKEKDENKR